MWRSVKNHLHCKAPFSHQYACCCCKGSLVGLRHLYSTTYFDLYDTFRCHGCLQSLSSRPLIVNTMVWALLTACNQTMIFIMTKYTCVRDLGSQSHYWKTRPIKLKTCEDLWIMWCFTNWTWPSQSDHQVTSRYMNVPCTSLEQTHAHYMHGLHDLTVLVGCFRMNLWFHSVMYVTYFYRVRSNYIKNVDNMAFRCKYCLSLQIWVTLCIGLMKKNESKMK